MLEDFLNAKPLFYDKIDYERFPRIYSKIKRYFYTSKIIHLIGTNGKGTTGRFLATALHNLGSKVGHYTSPHIMKFNERIWIDGVDVSDKRLELMHEKLLFILEDDDKNALSYFEYTTLLAMLVFEECEYIVLEAGLGGEFDATAVFAKDLTLVTPIDIDHEAFLGSNIQAIATTKLNAIQNIAILANQKHEEVYDIAKDIAKKKYLNIQKKQEYLSLNDNEKILIISKNLDLPLYLEQNLALAISALNFFNIEYDVSSFFNAKLFGRLTQFRKNIIVDVGHNPLAASSIVKELLGSKYILIYNTYKDKDYEKILSILKPIIKSVEIIDIKGQRVTSKVSLHKILNKLKIEYANFNKIDTNKNYLVFGSFSVVEKFLREYNE